MLNISGTKLNKSDFSLLRLSPLLTKLIPMQANIDKTSLLFLTVQSLFIIRLCTNKIVLKFTLLKQHIKIIVLF
jgi:hypothetical protein